MSFVRKTSLRWFGLFAAHAILVALLCAGGSRAAADAARAKSKDRLYHILPSETEIEFTMPGEGKEPLKVLFPNGASGTLNLANPKKSHFAIQLDTLQTHQKATKFDRHLIEAFFGVGESTDARMEVDLAWTKLSNKLMRNVNHVSFEVEEIDGFDSLADGERGKGHFHGQLVLWGTIRQKISFAVEAHRRGDRIELTSKEAFKFDFIRSMGPKTFYMAKAAFAATGDPAARNLPNQIQIHLKKIVLTGSY